jgi:hypothetical protein
MSPLHWLNIPGPLAAVLVVLSFPSHGVASVDRPDALMASSPAAPRYCGAAFRYAARTGNDDIAAESPAEAFAKDRHLARAHYAGTPAGFETVAARLRSATAMCGAG